MPNTALALFPFQEDYENNCLARTTDVVTTLVSAMKAWIVTKKGSRLGNMVGCFLPDVIHDLVGYSDMPGISLKLKSDISAQFRGVNFVSVDVNLSRDSGFVDVIVSIYFSTAATDITQLQVVMPTNIQTNI